jgi:hypothetical protein
METHFAGMFNTGVGGFEGNGFDRFTLLCAKVVCFFVCGSFDARWVCKSQLFASLHEKVCTVVCWVEIGTPASGEQKTNPYGSESHSVRFSKRYTNRVDMRRDRDGWAQP